MLSQGYFLNAYEISSVIGRGGFGIVYKGNHKELGVEVAIKEHFPSELCVRHGQTIQPSKPEFQASFEDSLDRFIREAKQLEKFRDYPNIVTCRDLFRANGTAYIVMDYVHGLPLSVLLERREARGEPFTEQDLLHVIIPLLTGLQSVHESEVYHRDIKPSNILIRRTDRAPILIDFGAAKHEMSRHTKSFAPYSDGYAAMEQVGEGEIGPWTDIYGIGAVMWRMVAGGAPPFSPPNPVTVQRRAFELMQGRADPLPSAIETGCNRFSDIVLQAVDDCLMINVSDRVQNCTEILERLAPTTQVDTQNSKLERQAQSSKYSELSQIRVKNETSRAEAQLETLKTVRSRKNNTRAVILLFALVGLLAFLGVLTQKRPEIDSSQQQFIGGDAEAQNDPDRTYANGEGVIEDHQDAVKQLHQAAEQDHSDAQYNLGHKYYKGEGVPQNFQEAAKWFRLAANQRNTDAQRMLGEMYYRGESVSMNFSEAIKWFRLAGNQGDAKAQAWLGHMYYSGKGVPKDVREGSRLYQLAYEPLHLASEQGDADAQGILGYMYLNGEGIPEDEIEGIKLYHLAAGQGLAWVQRNLGVRYYSGNSIPKNDQEAIKWLGLAADKRNAIAQFILGSMYFDGEGVPQNLQEAVKWFRLAAEQNHAPAQGYLGHMYYNGEGVPQNLQEAVKWFRLAAEQDHAAAQNYLGHMYYNGEGVPQNLQVAMKWFRLAAEQDHATAQNYLGHMYYDGEGVPQNLQEAVKWFRLAAEQDHATAQINLGYMYENGEGVSQNYIAAYAWYNIAIASGVADAEAARDRIQWSMTESQRQQAQNYSTVIYNRIQSSKVQ